MRRHPHSSQVFATPRRTGDISVRRATGADVEAALAIVEQVEADANDALRAKGVEPIPTRAIVERFVRRGELLMAEDPEGRPVGVVRVEDKYGDAEFGWLVSRDRIGTGVAASIVETVAYQLLCNGYFDVRAHVPAAAQGARGMLKDYGFSLRKTPQGEMRYRLNAEAWNRADAKRDGKPPASARIGRGGGGAAGEQGVLVDPRLRTPGSKPEKTIAAAFEPAREVDGLRIRRAELADIPGLLAVTEGEVDHRGNPADPDAMIRPILQGNIVVAEDAAGRVVGSVSSRSLSWRERDGVEIGWIVAPDMRRRGIASAMAREAMARLFEAGHEKVICKALVGNEASHRIAEALGMEPKPAEHGYVTYALRAAERVPPPGMAPA